MARQSRITDTSYNEAVFEKMESQGRERFSSQLGFLMTAAGCSIGLGNIYRFPYIVGEYGGAVFLIAYFICLILLGVPLVTFELAIGRGSQKSAATAMETLCPNEKKRWKIFEIFPGCANYMYQMFYTMITAQMVFFLGKMMTGAFEGMNSSQVKEVSADLCSSPLLLLGLTAGVILVAFLICFFGLQKSVERTSVYMMSFLIIVLILLAFNSLTLSGAREGLAFYLKPDMERAGNFSVLEIMNAAIGQAFFTLGFGAGSLCLFGSYLNREKRLAGHSIKIIGLDTGVAFLAGLIIFPACFTYGISPENGPDLLMITMPMVFGSMKWGRVLGSVFFLAIIMAAFTTVVTAFENLVGSAMDLFRMGRKKAVAINVIPMIICSLPAVLGMNVFDYIKIFGRNIMGAEDFLVANVLLPVSAIGYVLFCVSKRGWGWENFLKEANTGNGIIFPSVIRVYVKYILPAAILFMVVSGLVIS